MQTFYFVPGCRACDPERNLWSGAFSSVVSPSRPITRIQMHTAARFRLAGNAGRPALEGIKYSCVSIKGWQGFLAHRYCCCLCFFITAWLLRPWGARFVIGYNWTVCGRPNREKVPPPLPKWSSFVPGLQYHVSVISGKPDTGVDGLVLLEL